MQKIVLQIDKAVCENDGVYRYYRDGSVSVTAVTLALNAVNKYGYPAVFKAASELGIRVSDATIHLIEKLRGGLNS